MSNFYTYDYLTRQPNRMSAIMIFISVILLGIIIISLLLFLKHRDDGKYRELTIITILALLLTLTIQYDNWTQDRNSINGNGQVAGLMKQVAHTKKTNVHQIYSNSTALEDGMLLKVKSQIFKVQLNADNSSFEITKVHLTNPQINVINH
ncbi:DUF3290 domain-containing protein [Bombilactobacillus folatiphilus]|uniref:DUF3290 domain-containing protein n=1 Tax=Bombilactobacillus folatiphilus TaxID=2923362 RepID=A0ABY4PAD9_9LACO|nr:DUF3290 family protein [Bombilactobacillus folatiphilus]UQS82713.1 DUF3290 domain-containing protein [Bombilactobacillus folatiphilus]